MTKRDDGQNRAAGREMDDATTKRFMRDIHASISRHNARLELDRYAYKISVNTRVKEIRNQHPGSNYPLARHGVRY